MWRDAKWAGHYTALPEAIFLMRDAGITPRDKLFQRIMVHLQMALEDGLARALEPESTRLILCHRGTLDPLAYWLDRGWAEEEFFIYTGTNRELLYQRYTAMIHLVTAADGAPDYYTRWPDSHRPEISEDAIRLDRLLGQVWGGHLHYHRIDNEGCDWTEKRRRALAVLEQYR